MYELIAVWNRPNEVLFDGELSGLKPVDKYTGHNRSLGIDIGCYDNQIDELKYPLKLVSASYQGSYEDCEGRSYGDPKQG